MSRELLIHILRRMATSFRARRVAPHAMLAAAAVLWPGLAAPAAAAHLTGTVVDASASGSYCTIPRESSIVQVSTMSSPIASGQPPTARRSSATDMPSLNLAGVTSG